MYKQKQKQQTKNQFILRTLFVSYSVCSNVLLQELHTYLTFLYLYKLTCMFMLIAFPKKKGKMCPTFFNLR